MAPNAPSVTSGEAVIVIRCAAAESLDRLTTDCAWNLSRGRNKTISLPAGPYAYPYAAALELAFLVHNSYDYDIEDLHGMGLHRQALVDSLRPLVSSGSVVRVMRLDWLDAESVLLFSDFVRASLAVQRARAGGGLRFVCGIPGGAPNDSMRPLLATDISECIDIAGADSPSIPKLSSDDLQLVDALRASPNPMRTAEIAALLDIDKARAVAAINRLSEHGLVSGEGRIGLGAASPLAKRDEESVSGFRDRLCENDFITLPDARLALGCGGREERARLAWELGAKALEASEPKLAVRRFRLSGRFGKDTSWLEDLVYARALAGSGAVEAAAGIFEDSRERQANAHEAMSVAELGYELYTAGRIDQVTADRLLRRAERLNRDKQVETAVRARVLRAQIMVGNSEWQRAATLLRRVPKEQLEQVPTAVKYGHYLALANAYGGMGRLRSAHRCLSKARALDQPPRSRYRLEMVAEDLYKDEPLERRRACRNALALAIQSLHPADMELHIRELGDGPGGAAETIQDSLSSGSASTGVTTQVDPRAGIESAFQWFSARGATMLATLVGDRVVVLPKEADALPGLKAWFGVALKRMQAHPLSIVHPCTDVPNAGDFQGEFLLQSPGFGELGPTAVLFKREAIEQVDMLFEVASDLRAVFFRSLDDGITDPEQVRQWLDLWQRSRRR